MESAGTRARLGGRGRRRRRGVANDVVVVGEDIVVDDDDVVVVDDIAGEEVGVLDDRRDPKCITLLESSDEENHENNSCRNHKRQKPPLSRAEAADRALAERLQEEESLAAGSANNECTRNEWKALFTAHTGAARKRKAEMRLRREQDREFEEGLLKDQLKEIEQREAEEREGRGREEKKEAARLEMVKKASALDDARAMVEKREEPPVDAKGVVRLRFVLPNGKRVDRRFFTGDTIEVVRAFLTVLFDDWGMRKMKSIGLVTNFPKREFGEGDGELTLEKAGLAPQAVVMIRDLDA